MEEKKSKTKSRKSSKTRPNFRSVTGVSNANSRTSQGPQKCRNIWLFRRLIVLCLRRSKHVLYHNMSAFKYLKKKSYSEKNGRIFCNELLGLILSFLCKIMPSYLHHLSKKCNAIPDSPNLRNDKKERALSLKFNKGNHLLGRTRSNFKSLKSMAAKKDRDFQIVIAKSNENYQK